MRGFLKSSRVFLGAVALLAWAVGCGGAQAPVVEQVESLPERYRHGNLPYADVRVEGVDINGDGRADQFYVHDRATGALRWIERDLSFNGRVDVYEYVDAEGNVVERELLLTHGPAVTAVHFFRDGVLSRKEVDTGIAGSALLRKFYDASGALIRIERDSTYNGRIDLWEYFENGVLVRIGRDLTGDGVPDSIESTSRAGAQGQL